MIDPIAQQITVRILNMNDLFGTSDDIIVGLFHTLHENANEKPRHLKDYINANGDKRKEQSVV